MFVSYKLHSPNDSFEFGTRLGNLLLPGDVVLLNGDLGVGKTVITKGIAKALNIYEEITSPTFSIVLEYSSGKIPLLHWDFYRLEKFEELTDLDFDYLIEDQNICIIEWADRFKDHIYTDYIDFSIKKLCDESREIKLVSTGPRSQEIKNSLL